MEPSFWDKYRTIISSVLATLGVLTILGAWVLKPVIAQIRDNAGQIEAGRKEHEKHCEEARNDFDEKLSLTLRPLEQDIGHIKENMQSLEKNFDQKLEKLDKDFEALRKFLYEKL